MPKVSVIVPVYGVEKYIERCARSLFEQTLDDIEYLFIDDCTPDKSVDILLRVLDDYPLRRRQVVIHRMENNSGQAAVRTWGMKNVTGDYVIHCDSDDWLDKDAYRLMYETAIAENADVVVCDFVLTDGVNELHKFSGCNDVEKSKFIENLLFQKNSWSLVNKLVRRQIFYDKHDMIFPSRNMGEDMAICFQMILNANRVAKVQQILYYYCINNNSITRKTDDGEKMKNFLDDLSNVDILLKAFANQHLEKKYEDGIAYVKWKVKSLLWQTKFGKEVRELWRETYPELNKKIFILPQISVVDKLKYYLTNIGLYPRLS